MIDWHQIVSSSSKATTKESVSEKDLALLEQYLDMQLPEIYTSFLKFSDGLQVYSDVVFSAQQALKFNQEKRPEEWQELYMPFEGIFFFGEDANADRFFFRRFPNTLDNYVYVWQHESDSRLHLALDLSSFLKQYLSGEYV